MGGRAVCGHTHKHDFVKPNNSPRIFTEYEKNRGKTSIPRVRPDPLDLLSTCPSHAREEPQLARIVSPSTCDPHARTDLNSPSTCAYRAPILARSLPDMPGSRTLFGLVTGASLPLSPLSSRARPLHAPSRPLHAPVAAYPKFGSAGFQLWPWAFPNVAHASTKFTVHVRYSSKRMYPQMRHVGRCRRG